MSHYYCREGLIYGELANVIETKVSQLHHLPGKLIWAPELEFW